MKAPNSSFDTARTTMTIEQGTDRSLPTDRYNEEASVNNIPNPESVSATILIKFCNDWGNL